MAVGMKTVTKQFTVLDLNGKTVDAKGYADASQKALNFIPGDEGEVVIVIRIKKDKKHD